MPAIRRFDNCKVCIYADDHLPPHFHVEGRGFRVIVKIETMVARAGNVTRARARRWDGREQTLLRTEWARLNQRG
jgi:hypothetical protein